MTLFVTYVDDGSEDVSELWEVANCRDKPWLVAVDFPGVSATMCPAAALELSAELYAAAFAASPNPALVTRRRAEIAEFSRAREILNTPVR